MRYLQIFLALAGFLYATVINVPSDYTTIQEGLDASVDGDTVLVSEGEYFENLIRLVLISHIVAV